MSTLIDTQTFTSSGTWNKPSNAQTVDVLLIGGGGGGGSGGRGVSTNTKTGGTSGYCGCVTHVLQYPASELSSSESVTVGAGGSGGNPETNDNSNGNNGSNGDDSIFHIFRGLGGFRGRGGSRNNSNRNQIVSTYQRTVDHINYNGKTTIQNIESDNKDPPTSATQTASAVSTYSTGFISPAPGGHGGTNDNVTTYTPQPSFILDYEYASGGAVQTTVPAAGNPGNNGSTYQTYYGVGGSGGSASATVGYAGGNGGLYGSSGGGGGSSSNGNDSGTGGDGANGIVVVFSYN